MATYKLVGALSANGTKLYAPSSSDIGAIAGIVDNTNTTDATSTTAAALKTAGGLAVVKSAIIGTGVTLASTSGNVGIGIAHGSADGKLHVHVAAAGTIAAHANANGVVIENSATTGLSILTPDAENGNIYFGTPTGGNALARITSDYTNNRYTIGTGRVGATVVFNSDDVVANLTLSGASGSELTAAAGDVTAVKGMTTWNATAIPAGGTAGSGYKFSSTSNFGVFFGSGAPGLAAAKGSLYLRSDGSGVADRAYINTDGSTAWTAIATAG